MPATGQNDSNETPPINDISPTSPATSGKKRKTTASASRGVASLTPEQLAKKRANDREAQRAIRERTKAQIEELERRIQELTSQQPYQELQAALRQKDAIQAENEDIRRRLSSILAIIQPVLGAQGLTDLASAAQPESTIPINQSATQHEHHVSGQSFSDASSLSMETPSPSSGTTFRRTWQNNTPPAPGNDRVWSPVNAFDYQRSNMTHGLEFGASGERLGLGFLLDGTQHVVKGKDLQQNPQATRTSPIGISSSYPQMSGHSGNIYADSPKIPYAEPVLNIAPTCPLDSILLEFLHARQTEAARGVSRQRLVGPEYPSVSSLLNPDKPSHPLSKVFTDILSKFPDISGLPEQVAVLYVMFLLMRWEIFPTLENYEKLPEWMTPRPSQLFTPHPAWIDYLPWPRMRNKMVASYQNYPFENWFIPYTTTLSLNWPYEPTDALLKKSDGELVINPVFETHLRNLQNWSLGPAFAKAHPMLADTVRIKDNRKINPESSG